MDLEHIKVILLDIEGTTTPIDFVHKTLFAFARKQTKNYLNENFDAVQNELAQLRTENEQDWEKGLDVPSLHETSRENAVESFTHYIHFLIGADRKSAPLKSLQGKIWQAAYESGGLESEIYEDVPRAFERWKFAGKTTAIFSSGSILAQKLLFKNTNYGDLTSYISGFFDTNVGAKKNAESYLKIASAKSFPQVENFLFISDVAAELDAARQAGMQTRLCVRLGNAPVSKKSKHEIIYSFDEV